MKTIPTSGLILPRLAILAGLLLWTGGATAATPYREETHGPRIGTRIVLFFRDLAFFDNPSDRYRHLPKNQPPAQPQQHTYGAQSPGQRYNLDHPPVVGSGEPQRRPQPLASRPPLPGTQPTPDAVPHDMPYATSDASPSDERGSFQAGVGGQREDLPQVTIKPKVTAPKPAAPAVAPKPAEPGPSAQSTPPAKKTGVPETPTPESKPPVQIASNPTTPSNKPWQNPTSANTATPPAPSPDTGMPPATQPSGNTTLTGSKTSKDGRVKSPYSPFNELDVSGLPTGSLAMDPTTGKVFRVP